MAACFDAGAMGFGAAPQGAVLGQPLNFTLSVRLDPGETLPDSCLSAEVMLGDHRVSPSLVRATFEPRGSDAGLLRVTTSVAVDEPVISVNLVAGCTATLSRRFTLLADPPPALPVVMAMAPAAQQVSLAPAMPASGLPMTAQAAPAPLPAATPAAAAAPVAAPASAAAPRPMAQARQPRTPPSAAPPVARPRLRLDAVDTVAAGPVSPADAAIDEAIVAVAEATRSMRAAAEAASASARRVAELEQAMQSLRKEVQASREDAVQARQASASPAWRTPLVLALLALAGLAGWLAWRLRTLQQAQQQSWLRAARAEAATAHPTAPIPLVNSELELPEPSSARNAAPRPAWPVPVSVSQFGPPSELPAPATRPAAPRADDIGLEPGSPHAVTEVLPPGAAHQDGAPRDVSIDELLDLEQQADFFVVLGQDDAAVDLLVDHLRVTGGGSPLPYLKLLEIYRRTDDRSAYEQTRSRFNDRFNAYAPEWSSDLQGGRTLDDYVGVLPRLAQVWQRPLDAMAELEALLFRKSRGDLFDLPAYREVLFLYSLARDLLEREPLDAGGVDVLLPLADGSEFGTTAASPFMVMAPERNPSRDEAPLTAAGDLDIELEPLPPPGRRS